MKEPWFWRDDSLAARAAATALEPAALLYDCGQRLRAAFATPMKVAAPVICVGNASLGGVGKTPFALMLHAMLKERGVNAAFLSRGYGGALKGPLRVNEHHRAGEVGDEPLLLAAAGPTFIAKNRAAGAMAAAGADAIIMDDGFQNPEIAKTLSFLLISGADPSGNGRIFPAGPMREPLARAIGRADAVVLVGAGDPVVDAGGRPVFRATTQIETDIEPQKAVAFCGIGAPQRFFDTLEDKGYTLVVKAAYPDHHFYSEPELAALKGRAALARCALITTEKDFVRLTPAQRDGVRIARLMMKVDRPEELSAFTLKMIGRMR